MRYEAYFSDGEVFESKEFESLEEATNFLHQVERQPDLRPLGIYGFDTKTADFFFPPFALSR